jgi:hypothetical protein
MQLRFLRFCLLWSFASAPLLAENSPLILTPAPNDVVEHFPAIKLRAYGTLSGEEKTSAGQPASSVLLVTCASEAKAKLVLAKYLSDLGLLPGVSTLALTTDRGAVTAHQADKQGVVAALRCERQVFIFTAADGPALTALVNGNVPASAKVDASEAEITVPMYVDRWDKYGFRFYYGPFTKPKDSQGRDVPENYNPIQDFEFADKSDKTGLVLWNSPLNAATADGLFDTQLSEWTYKTAKAHGLPVGINIGITDQNSVLANRYPDGVAPDAEGYLGGWYYEAPSGIPTLSWASTEAQEAGLSQLKGLVTDLNGKYDNIVNYLEPHEETSHGIADLLDDHGADAKKSFYAFLKDKYGGVEAVGKRYGAPYATWSDVPFPELATFFGFEGDAIDLTGTWKMSTTAAYDASSARPELDDSSWANEPAPGHNIARFTPRKPTVMRRHLTVDPAWRAAHPKSWLYLWDLENTTDQQVFVYVNGQLCPENPPMRRGWHFSQVEITSALKDGDNLITFELPVGFIDYRSYLTGEAPTVYPALATTAMNARYADWSDWCGWSRGQAVRRGMQMIRQVDPDKPITLMSPGYWWDDYKDSVEDYGAILHDTGGMAGFWNDINPSSAQSTGLPTDCEPGGPAGNLDDFKKYMGRWSTENTQGVDYFGHLGDVLWHPDIKAYFDQTQPLWHLMGKYHLPQPEVADLTSIRTERLFSFPMNLGDHGSSDPDLIATGPGVFASGVDGTLSSIYTRGGIIERDFARGIADPYRVVVDTNSSILDPETIDAIGKWVKRGGTFITFQQTGRHTSTQHDVWPISKLTGYDVTAIDRKGRNLKLAPGQSVLPEDAMKVLPNNWGLTMKKHDSNDASCQDVALWDDGTVAAGARKLGKGMVIDFGMFDSLPLITQALDKMGIKHVPGHVADGKVIMRHFVSNNGLYDVWTMWNQDGGPMTVDLDFDGGLVPIAANDVNTGDALPITTDAKGAKIAGIAFEPLQTRVLITPRGKLADAPAEWFRVQRGWWRGTADPGKPMAAYAPKIALDLSHDCAFKIIPAAFTGENPPEDPSLSDPKTDDSSWSRASLGIFDIPDNTDVHHVVYRKHFTVPANWNHGPVYVFGKSELPGNNGSIRRYMDGKPFGGQIVRDDLGGILKAGSMHVLTTEIWGKEPPLGTVTPAWITYRPDPASQLLLNDWAYAGDFLSYTGHSPLPAAAPDSGSQRCEVEIDPKLVGQTVMLHVICNNAGINALLFNGHYYSNYGPNIWPFIDANVTPFVKFGQKNEVIVVGRGAVTIQKASLDFYAKNVFP